MTQPARRTRYIAAKLNAGWSVMDRESGFSVSLGPLLDAERDNYKTARRQAAALNKGLTPKCWGDDVTPKGDQRRECPRRPDGGHCCTSHLGGEGDGRCCQCGANA